MNYRRLFTATIAMALSAILMAGGRKVLFIGDSITDGAWGNSKVWNTPSEERNQNDMNHIYGHGFMMIAAAQTQACYPKEGWIFWNRGISGNTLDDLEARWQKDVLALNPDIVSILIGTNDVDKALKDGRDIDVKAWGDKLRMLLDEVLKQNSDAHFVLCTPFVANVGKIGARTDYAIREQMIASLTAVITTIATEYHATLVPFNTLVSDTLAATPDLPASYWIWDGIHPTPAMHYLMAQLWLQNVITP